jgi:hypothetical protein
LPTNPDTRTRTVPVRPVSLAEVAILELEGTRCKYPEAKKAAIYDRFGCTPTRYYRVLNALIDTLAALAAAPVTVNRLRRLRRSVRASS